MGFVSTRFSCMHVCVRVHAGSRSVRKVLIEFFSAGGEKELHTNCRIGFACAHAVHMCVGVGVCAILER